jgi:hypothetical protein
MLSSLLVVVLQAQLPQSLPRWAQTDVRSTWADKVPMSAYRKDLQKLRFEADVVDEKKVRKLYDTAFQHWKSSRTKDSAFELLSLFAYFPMLSSAPFSGVEQRLLDSCLKFAGDYSNIEYAFVASCAYVQDRRGKLDLGLYELLLKRASEDPQLGPLSYYLLSHHADVTQQRKDAILLTERLAKRFPLRDEYWSALLMAANWNVWSSSGKPEAFRQAAVKHAKAVLAHAQSGKDSKGTAEMLLKEMGG